VKPSSRDSIIVAVEEALKWAGAEDFDSGMAQFSRILIKLQERHEPMRSRERFAEVLDSIPEPTWLEMQLMKSLFRYFPYILRFGAREFSRKVEEEVPALPAGRPGLDAYSKARIVAEISDRQLRGYNLKQAKTQTARRLNLSFSTIQRAWDDRANREEVDFRSVVAFLADGGELLDDPRVNPSE
jgi:hypothetical protein